MLRTVRTTAPEPLDPVFAMAENSSLAAEAHSAILTMAQQRLMLGTEISRLPAPNAPDVGRCR
jgi:hypothetical protein